MRPDFIDVSDNNPRFDGHKLSATGIIGVIARSFENTKPDRMLQAHAAEAHRIGLEVGTYAAVHPSRRPGSAEEQATLAAKAHLDVAASLALACDLELNGEHLTPQELAVWLMTWFTTADAITGQRAMLYSGRFFVEDNLGAEAAPFAKRALWLPQYGGALAVVPWPWVTFLLWQYAGNTVVRYAGADGVQATAYGPAARDIPGAVVIAEPGKVDGIGGEVDCNVLGNASVADVRAGAQPAVLPDLATSLGRQQALRMLGSTIALDGQWGPASARALASYQRAHGLNPDGLWGEGTASSIALGLRDI